LRRLRMTAAEIAEVLELPLSTVSLWLKRIGRVCPIFCVGVVLC
jgi:DNA-directed RNA polymerase specialized sigma24 family protein